MGARLHHYRRPAIIRERQLLFTRLKWRDNEIQDEFLRSTIGDFGAELWRQEALHRIWDWTRPRLPEGVWMEAAVAAYMGGDWKVALEIALTPSGGDFDATVRGIRSVVTLWNGTKWESRFADDIWEAVCFGATEDQAVERLWNPPPMAPS